MSTGSVRASKKPGLADRPPHRSLLKTASLQRVWEAWQISLNYSLNMVVLEMTQTSGAGTANLSLAFRAEIPPPGIRPA